MATVPSAGVAAADRVDQQVSQDPAHLLAVHLDGHRFDAVTDQPDAQLAGERVRAREGVADQVVEGHPGAGEGEGARVDAGELEEVADHVVEAFDLGADLAEVAVGVGGDTVLQGLGHRAETGERGAQVVGDPGDEFTAG